MLEGAVKSACTQGQTSFFDPIDTILSVRVFKRVLSCPWTSLRPLMSSETPTTSVKVGGYQFYRDVLGSPRYIVAPMVDQSELVCLLFS